jgi:glycosyltransferase involved in cell wall biosynthesis
MHGGAVTISGRWPAQPWHVISFPNPCLTAGEISRARCATEHKRLLSPIQLLFSGRLHPAKGARRALRVLAALRERGVPATLDVVGDGPQWRELHELARRSKAAGHVVFHGWLPPAALQQLYERAHFLLLPSLTEGFPKVVSEAMAYKCVPLAGAVSCIPDMLDSLGAGVAVPAEDILAFVVEIERLAANPLRWHRMAARGQQMADIFSYEIYVERVRSLLQMGKAPAPESPLLHPLRMAPEPTAENGL